MTTWTSSTHSLYTLQRPTWLTNAGLSKGIGHDKQTLGVILEPGTIIRIRHSSPSNGLAMVLELLNDDGSKENFVHFGNEPSEFTVTHKSVPFISTLYTDTPSNIEILIEYSTKPSILPIHDENTATAAFFKLWEDQSSAFALISTYFADILVPAKDRSHLKQLHESTGMAHLARYYQSIFEYFNQLAGLSFSTDTLTDKNIPNRYFMKANRTGGGAAYYAHSHTAETNDSVAGFWLDPRPENWGSIHEIGHGYQGLFMSYSEIGLGEVWNNLYAYFYQAKYLGNDLFKNSWLYHGDQEMLFDITERLFDTSPPINSWQLHERLFYLILIFNKSGTAALTAFNQNYRALSNQPGFRPKDHTFTELLITSCAKISNIDISPFLRTGQISNSRVSSIINQYSNRKPVCPLYKLVPKEIAADLVRKLGLGSRLDLIDNLDLKEHGLMGNIELLLDKKLFDEFKTKDFMLRNGTNVTNIVNISSQQILISTVPAGIYTLQAPSASNGKLSISTQYIEVKTNTTNIINIEYQYTPGVRLASQTIQLNGLYGEFALIDIDSAKDNIGINIHAERPHIYFGDQLYASITIRDKRQRILFESELQGNSIQSTKLTIPAAADYTIEIFHAEPGRNMIFPASDAVLSPDKKNITLTMTAQGLNNIEMDTPVEKNLEQEIDKLATMIKTQPHMLLYRDHPLVDDLYVAIDSFNKKEHSRMVEKFKDMYVSHQNTQTRIVAGTNFTWQQRVLGNETIANIEFNLTQRTVHIEVYPYIPHSYFDSIYVAIWAHNKNGNLLFCQELRGNSLAEHTSISLPFPEGSEINIFHAEPSRSPIINQDTKEQYEVMQRHRVLALDEGKLAI